ncbi:MAG TPA: hypothetical protein VGX02_06440, partial [Candidatus Eremiobacteraceae bacterium]|nr:hypothetical protein [Candidatus Eremiobacteraceae bacterium]
MTLRAALLLSACTIVLAACTSNNGAPPPPVNVHQRLFVANFAAGGASSSLVAYVFPLTAAIAPNSTLPSSRGPNGATGIAFDFADDLYIANASNNTIIAYIPFIGNSSSPSLTLTNGISQPQDMAFDNGSNLYVANLTGGAIGNVTVYTPPFVNSSFPLFAISNG